MERSLCLSDRMSGYLVKRFDATDPYYDVRYHLSGLKVKDLYNRYRSYMRTEGLEERIMTLPDLRAYICRTYGMSHVRVVYGESDTARSWGEFRIGD